MPEGNTGICGHALPPSHPLRGASRADCPASTWDRVLWMMLAMSQGSASKQNRGIKICWINGVHISQTIPALASSAMRSCTLWRCSNPQPWYVTSLQGPTDHARQSDVTGWQLFSRNERSRRDCKERRQERGAWEGWWEKRSEKRPSEWREEIG